MPQTGCRPGSLAPAAASMTSRGDALCAISQAASDVPDMRGRRQQAIQAGHRSPKRVPHPLPSRQVSPRDLIQAALISSSVNSRPLSAIYNSFGMTVATPLRDRSSFTTCRRSAADSSVKFTRRRSRSAGSTVRPQRSGDPHDTVGGNDPRVHHGSGPNGLRRGKGSTGWTRGRGTAPAKTNAPSLSARNSSTPRSHNQGLPTQRMRELPSTTRAAAHAKR